MAALALILAFPLVALVRESTWDVQGREAGDVFIYARYAQEIEDGALPYRDVFVEYPPGALPVIVLPALVTRGPSAYMQAFVSLMVVFVALTAVLGHALARTLGSGAWAALVPAGLTASVPLLLGPVTLHRFDFFLAALVAIALLLALKGRLALASAALAVAVLAKLYALVLLPLLLGAAWHRARARGVARAAAAFAVVVLAVTAPFLVLAPDGLVESARYQASRPLHVEALSGSLVLALRELVGFDLDLDFAAGSAGVGGARGELARLPLTVLLVAALALVWRRGLDLCRSKHGLAVAAAGAVTVITLLSHVLSPQFLIWLVPLVALLPGWLGIWAIGLYVAALVASNWWFPELYVRAARQEDGSAVAVLVARNLLLVALLVVVLAAVLRSPVPAIPGDGDLRPSQAGAERARATPRETPGRARRGA